MCFARFVQKKYMSSSTKPTLPKGTRDFGPLTSAKRSYILEAIKRNFRKYGFSQIETPAMENLEVLTGKYGDEGDQLLFKIINSGDYLKNVNQTDLTLGSKAVLPKISEKGLRYDLTVPFARFVVQNRNDITFPFKRFQIQPVWRADRPQKGRYREFYQCDADSVGSDSLWNEVELTLLIHDVFTSLNYNGFLVKINHRDVLNTLAAKAGLTGKEIPFCVAIDKLDKVGEESVRAELVELGATEADLDLIFALFNGNMGNDETLSQFEQLIKDGDHKGVAELSKYFEYLTSSGRKDLSIKLDLSLARGLTYYTGMIFEVKATDVAIGSISGGGRYDNLTGHFGLSGVSGVGISFGLDRIYDVLEEKRLFPEGLNEKIQVLVCHLEERSFLAGIQIVAKLREAGIASELYPEVCKLKKQLSYANNIQSPFTLVIGENEIADQRYPLKNMSSGQQMNMSLQEIISQLQNVPHPM